MITISIILGFIKSFFSGLLSFFSTTLGQLILIVIVFSACIYFTYTSGYKTGSADTAIKINKEYQKQLDKKLEEQKVIQQKITDDAVAFVLSQNQKEIVYQDKLQIVEKLVSKNIDKKEICKWSDKDLQDFNAALDGIK